MKVLVIGGGIGGLATALHASTVQCAHELLDTPIKGNATDPDYTATDFNH